MALLEVTNATKRFGGLTAVSDLVTIYLEQGDYKAGMRHATRLLEMDPLLESAHRQMMLLLAGSGQRNAALAQYETCRQRLSEELGVDPDEETQHTFALLLDGRWPSDIPHSPRGGVQAPRWHRRLWSTCG